MRKFGFVLMLAVIAAVLMVAFTAGVVSADTWPPVH
jgi:hypothetical protein